MTIEEAKEYINFGIKEGVYEPEQFEGMTDEWLIEFATREGDRGDAQAESQEEEE